MNIKKVKMYTQPNCSFCLSAEALCDTRNIQIEQKIDIAESVRNKSNLVRSQELCRKSGHQRVIIGNMLVDIKSYLLFSFLRDFKYWYIRT
jgi:glutaredoxin